MATTRGQGEPETPRAERMATILNGAIAGQGIVRRTVLYAVMFACMGLAFYAPVLVVPAIVCGILLLTTDTGLA